MSSASCSARATPSPGQGPVPDDESAYPKGHCRYILLNAPIKGERCGCTGFLRNKDLPGLSCDCGHLAVFHVTSPESNCPLQQSLAMSGIQELMRRVERLEKAQEEQQAEKERKIEDHASAFVARIGDLEQLIENNKEDQSTEVSKAFANISSVWHHFDQLKRRMDETFLRFETHFRHIETRLSDVDGLVTTLSNRQRILDDDQLSLLDRVDQLEAAEKEEDEDEEDEDGPATPNNNSHPPASQPRGRRRQPPASESVSSRRRSSATRSAPIQVPPPRPLPFRYPGSQAWTVHISLLPQSNLFMPFEKDTNAYKRCLSRGLHQMIAVQGPDSESFVAAVEKAFCNLLKGRQWMPLQAMLCDVQQLQGLPMVRPLDQSLIDQPYSLEFLKQHCAVCDSNGKVDSLYIAMRGDQKLSWQVIRMSDVFLDGLEACWEFDPKLDNNGLYKESAGAILTTGMSTTASSTSTAVAAAQTAPGGASNNERKRNLSEISRTPSFGSATVVCEGDGSRPKMARTCMALVQGKS